MGLKGKPPPPPPDWTPADLVHAMVRRRAPPAVALRRARGAPTCVGQTTAGGGRGDSCLSEYTHNDQRRSVDCCRAGGGPPALPRKRKAPVCGQAVHRGGGRQGRVTSTRGWDCLCSGGSRVAGQSRVCGRGEGGADAAPPISVKEGYGAAAPPIPQYTHPSLLFTSRRRGSGRIAPPPILDAHRSSAAPAVAPPWRRRRQRRWRRRLRRRQQRRVARPPPVRSPPRLCTLGGRHGGGGGRPVVGGGGCSYALHPPQTRGPRQGPAVAATAERGQWWGGCVPDARGRTGGGPRTGAWAVLR